MNKLTKIFSISTAIITTLITLITLITFLGHDIYNVTGQEQPKFPMNILIWIIPLFKVILSVLLGWCVFIVLETRRKLKKTQYELDLLKNLLRISYERMIKNSSPALWEGESDEEIVRCLNEDHNITHELSRPYFSELSPREFDMVYNEFRKFRLSEK